MINWIKYRRRREEGQAMPMAAVGVFIMALAVLATLNLGQAVHQKIRLQNTADSAAYSLAAMEARTFNYIAFLNRTQIAHYNTAMVVQSYMTWVGHQVAFFATAVDLLLTLKEAAKQGMRQYCCCPKNSLGCQFKAAYAIVAPVADAFRKLRDQAVDAYNDGHEKGHEIIEAMSIFNNDAVWQTQLARSALLNGHILTGMQSFIGQLDKEINFMSGKSALLNMFVNGALNSIEYYQTFDSASGLNPSVFKAMDDYEKRLRPGGAYKDPDNLDDAAKDAYRIMAELCHATRTPKFVSDRSEQGTVPASAGMATLTGLQKMGQTKFTSDGNMSGPDIPAVRNEEHYPVGAFLSAYDYVKMVSGVASAGIANAMITGDRKLGDAIAAYKEDASHYLYKTKHSDGKISPDGQGITSFAVIPGPGKETMGKEGCKPGWTGFAPYFKLKPSGDRTRDYNQPSTWIFLNKHHEEFQTAGGSHGDQAPWYSKFTWKDHKQVAQLNTAIGSDRNSYLFEGLNVLSRGMVYYHRPGNWKEHPNFFNPYWRARLAPVGQKLQNLWDRYVTQKIKTDSDSKFVQGAVGFLKNAQMDLFTAAITSIITH